MAALKVLFLSFQEEYVKGILYSLLFIIIMKALSNMVGRAVEEGHMMGFKVKRSNADALSISHSLFADEE